MEDKQFARMQIVFREGKQAFKSYAQRGLCLDGTFLKIRAEECLDIKFGADLRRKPDAVQIVCRARTDVSDEELKKSMKGARRKK
uniref:AlNc14C86G5492 protein n=1 Tax=Albugo laibachii Nc14 TaxID=890382 RepID=F0WFV7_9STRA|nr:AlNc14C86G5492 [Albugo laibachii Nc14]|eukprot:CCA20091.1 AlNc14C86G5492 [Albugo laibachii Nc14]